ncbi:uncharacterized protein CEXT_592141 [Caerostris extrusa]|uniref:DUF7153 domain-containing protein n=1 Tax=Caerostris extrusa TaxID=172846 RepID=A0AAV4SQS3_CAEEX|nr:uncharacterized protein CEXT_592141 [Caerostris extrusa]
MCNGVRCYFLRQPIASTTFTITLAATPVVFIFFQAGYEEVASIIKPSLDDPIPNRTGYIISAFRVFPGEDREKLEKNWLTWTGARQVYTSLPRHLGLRRLTFHKKLFPDGGITYVLMCECSALVQHVTEALVFVDHLRARCCGYTALYRPVDVFDNLLLDCILLKMCFE